MGWHIRQVIQVRKTDRLRDMSFGIDDRLFKLKWQLFYKTYIKWPLIILFIIAVIYVVAAYFRCGNLQINCAK